MGESEIVARLFEFYKEKVDELERLEKECKKAEKKVKQKAKKKEQQPLERNP